MVRRRTKTMEQLVGSPRRRRSGAGPFASVAETNDKLEAVVAYRNGLRTQEARPWIPGDYARMPKDQRDVVLAEFQHYVVVDDLEEDASPGTVVLIRTRWPGIDRQGRIRFARNPDDERDDRVFDREAEWFRTFVSRFRCWLDNQGSLISGRDGDEKVLQDRPIRIGDAFAMNDAALVALQKEELEGAVMLFDITGSARELAKISYYAAASGVLDASVNEDLARLAWDEQGLAKQGPA